MSLTGSLRALGSAHPGPDRLALAGLVVVALIALVALAAPVLPLADPNATDLTRRLLPAGTAGYPLGTDQLGRDLLSRLVWGIRVSLAVGLFAVAIAAALGTAIGLVAGFFRGWLGSLLMRVIDVLLAFPYLLLALAIVAALGPGLKNAMIAIAVANIPLFARTVRGTVLELAQRPFVEAARLGGSGRGRIIAAELLPNCLPVVVVMISTNLGWMILETAGLSFLGLGAQPPTADLGGMLGGARELLTTVPRVAILPGLAILVLVVGINLVGDWLRDLMDPRLRGEAPGPASGTECRSAAVVRPGVAEGSLLRAEGLRTCFHLGGPVHRVVDGLDLDLAPGERVALVGESGSGKTIAALSLLGLVPPPGQIDGGKILFRGEDLVAAPESRWRALRGGRLVYVPQDPMTALNPVLPIGAQIVETLRAHSDMDLSAARERALWLLGQVRLRDPEARVRGYPHALSGGERQRVAIAMALANDPDVIIADEATTALDVTVQAEILALLDDLCSRRGAALIFITHDLALARGLCHRGMVMYAGRVVEQGSMDDLMARPAHPYTRALIDCIPELGRPEKPLRAIPGWPPALDASPRGCAFAPRCPLAGPDCSVGEIQLRPLSGSHAVRCIRAAGAER